MKIAYILIEIHRKIYSENKTIYFYNLYYSSLEKHLFIELETLEF